MDRISQLPEPIVHHILSLSGSRELVRMSVASKTWFQLTASFPSLDFRMDELTKGLHVDFTIYNFTKGLHVSRQTFFKYVDYTTSRMCQQNVTAHKLTIVTNIREPAELDTVNRCLELLLKKGVTKLEINLSEFAQIFLRKTPSFAPKPKPMPTYVLPNILLSVSVLESLIISGCELPSSFMVDALKFKSLIRLQLEYVHIDDEMINYLTTSCPLLKEFSLSSCHGFKRFCVNGHQNLELLDIDCDSQVEMIDIETPNLLGLKVRDTAGRGPPGMKVALCKNLTSVTYIGYPLPNSNDFADFLSKFSCAESLVLFINKKYRCNTLKLSSHSLRKLVIDSEFDLEEIELSTPNLGLFIYSNPLSFWVKAMHLPHLEACMRCHTDGSLDTLWLQKLRLFLDKKNGFKALNLYIHTKRVCFFDQIVHKFIVLGKLKVNELAPYELEHIELHFKHEESSNYAAFVDAVLLCFRPQSLTLRFPLIDFKDQSDLAKFTYEKLLEQENQEHTNIEIVLPSSSKAQKLFRGSVLYDVLPCEEKAISFTKEKGTLFYELIL
ncbi:putative leucine-rich repeat domain superfamily, F-box-like domain superfamily [Helianthus annuus]|uniref:Leucine-rich repeat domain superfamily, F-box-like domain superfamily n=1 Tax=Helianthus annuus TaxID=4232 RepID=A0A9K3NFM5_HELAN|nr:putative leucine-rich repeat domain superfamily, F-box-like domain superfamily [Helianthus annuus]KAJ0550131.1 putative leucine-rich repeat domain superfamily, F-box-like domain superfamily [Helianthus annuus]KAJ0556742.1 putative leucine-rich repeat domain superfamily, F-box-like domain superfamily [Helianthus annuus]KAJ0563084.1 putative leucine-rich repeat domain superfamily, F-box-like domain superfamily [Helianthus annuus]KAJ0728454.1 putative leucine-rich repeat domain superfamily, F-b